MSEHLDRTIEPPVTGFTHLSIASPDVITLPNGINIYAINAGDQPVNRILVSYDSGLINAEIPDALQLAVKLLREGTISYTGSKISETLDFYGAWLKSSVLNGNTTITLWSPNKSTKHLLPILKEILLAPTFPEKEFVKMREKRKAQQLLALKNVSYISSKLDKQLVFGENHPMNHILNADEIEALSIEEIKTEYQKVFSRVPKVFISGEISEILNEVKDFFSKFEYSNTLSTPHNIVPMSPSSGRTVIEEVDTEHQAAITMSIPTIDRKHHDYISLRLVVMALGGYFGSRLMTNIREDKGYTYGIQASLLGYREGGVISISTNTDTQYIDSVINEVKNEIRRMQEELMSEEELNVVKNNAMTSLAAILDGPFSIMDYHISHYHNDTPENYFSKQIDAINSLTTIEIMELAKKYFIMENLLISIAKPASKANSKE